jgi:hypothetical protein
VELSSTKQDELIRDLGFRDEMWTRYRTELSTFLDGYLKNQQNSKKENIKKMSVEEVQRCIKLQIQFMKSKGMETVEKVLATTK